jgi:flagellar M-ring protein FliF
MLSRDLFKYALIALIVAYLIFKIIRPLIRQMFPPPPPPPPPPTSESDDDDEESEEEAEEKREPTAAELFEQKKAKAQEIAQQNPKAIANIIKEWMNPNAG